jgi:hypothetical protein
MGCSKMQNTASYENFKNDTIGQKNCRLLFKLYIPIYYGCNNIVIFLKFYIQLDRKTSTFVIFKSYRIKKWEENLDGISEARNLIFKPIPIILFCILNNLFAEIDKEILKIKKVIHFKGKNDYFDNYPLAVVY